MQKTNNLYNPVTFVCCLVIVVGCLVHMYFGYTHRGRPGHAWGCDDAYISYRYAQNLAEGKGLVFNESEKVEGYSNFLYVLISAPLVDISPGRIYFLSCALNILFLLAGWWLFRRFVEYSWGGLDSHVAGLLFALCPVLWVWTVSGMETPLILMIQIAIWVYTEKLSVSYDRRHFILFALVSSLSLLSRADGFLFPLIAVAVLALRRRYRTALISLFVLSAVAAAYFGWRIWYYGDWLPNTFYVKVSGPLGERIRSAVGQLREVLFLKGLVAHFALVVVAFFHGVSATLKARDFTLMRIDSGPVFLFGLLAYWLYIGGDVFVDRFLIFAVPVGLFSLSRAARLFNERYALAGLALVVLLFQATPVLRDPNFDYSKNKYDHWVTLGKYLGQHHPGSTLAVDAAGKIPYFSGLYTIDMLGLTEPAIGRRQSSFFRLGHNKFDPDYILSRKPDFIAAWGHPNRDMRFGLTRHKYETHGYTVKYLVNSTRTGKPENIVDVEAAAESAFDRTFKDGYQYFVLKKTSTTP